MVSRVARCTGHEKEKEKWKGGRERREKVEKYERTI